MSHISFKPPAGPGACAEISSLLLHLAGEFAPAIAACWPAPHTGFLTAPAARRQLLGLALASGAAPAELPQLAQGPLKSAIPKAVGDPPVGLARALARMGEPLWGAADYGRLLWALRHPKAGKLVRHAAGVSPELVHTLASLPDPMLFAASRKEFGLAGAQLLRECYEAVARVRGEAEAQAQAARWAGMSLPRLRKDLLAAFAQELPPPPFPGTSRLRPLTSLAELRAAGRRYHNCLREDLTYAAGGEYAYYEWLGEPGAVVELYRDEVIGWRFEQARLAHNVPVPPPLGEEILAELAAMGVNLGRPYWKLRQAVFQLGRPGFSIESLDQVAAERFGRD